ncbi:uncharacterized protein [Asterias amurensis]|uniref:uncharacterized protein n=1 Tax=Asterias amurensis TaxID=7602 RepID=UPI003AB23D28
MPRAFLVKKTRTNQHERLKRDYDTDAVEDVDLKKPLKVDIYPSRYNAHDSYDPNTFKQHRITFPNYLKTEEQTVLNPVAQTQSTRCVEERGLDPTPEPIDLSRLKYSKQSPLRISSTSAFEHVRPSYVQADDTQSSATTKLYSSDYLDGESWEGKSGTYRDEPLDLQVRRQGVTTPDSESTHSNETVTPVEIVLPRPWNPTLFPRGLGGPTPASALRSLTVGDSPTRSPSLQGVDFNRYSTDWGSGLDGYRSFCKQERVMVLTSDSPVREGGFEVSSRYNIEDPYTYHTNTTLNVNHPPSQDVRHHKSLSPSQTQAGFLSQHGNFLRSSEHPKERVLSKRSARQPILGLEYIQNNPDCQDRHELSNDEAVTEENDPFLSHDESKLDDVVQSPPSYQQTSDINTEETSDQLDLKPTQHKKYICDVCGKGFSRSNTLVTHKRIHTGDKPFKCELCGRAFRQPGNLTRHRLTHTTVKPYVCQQCGKAFNRASNLHTHMRTHTNYKPFICQYCGKGFHQKIDMKIHSYTHTGEKPHKCKKCGRGFKQLTHLTYHMRTHSEVKMYTCAYCGKGFNQKGNLQAHIYGHTGERPYHCEVCNKGFTLASTLNTHRRTHADKKPFACQYCGKDFYQKNALKSHMIASHPYTGESLL